VVEGGDVFRFKHSVSAARQLITVVVVRRGNVTGVAGENERRELSDGRMQRKGWGGSSGFGRIDLGAPISARPR